MRIPPRFTLLAALAAFVPQVAPAQTALETYYNWTMSFSTYATYGWGGYDRAVSGGGPDTWTWANYPAGGTVQSGTGNAAGTYGALTASTSVYANGQTSSIWYNSAAAMYTQMFFRDLITVTAPGQLDFSLLMGDVLHVNTPADPGCGSSYSPYWSGHCMRAASKLDVVGAINSHLQLGHTTLTTAPPSVTSGPINVNTGDIFELSGYLMVGGSACEVYSGFPCVDPNGAGTTVSGSAWANFYIDEQGGADYTSASGTSYAAAVTTTPEPASLALMATGLLGIVGVARRRRAQ